MTRTEEFIKLLKERKANTRVAAIRAEYERVMSDFHEVFVGRSINWLVYQPVMTEAKTRKGNTRVVFDIIARMVQAGTREQAIECFLFATHDDKIQCRIEDIQCINIDEINSVPIK